MMDAVRAKHAERIGLSRLVIASPRRSFIVIIGCIIKSVYFRGPMLSISPSSSICRTYVYAFSRWP